MKEYIIKNKKEIIAFSFCFIIIAALYLTIQCPIKFFTGICCPGCGMTRALLSILRLDFAAALHYHPCIFIMPVAAVIFIMKKKINPTVVRVLLILFILILFIIYLYRLINGSDVVYIDFERGIIYKILESIK